MRIKWKLSCYSPHFYEYWLNLYQTTVGFPVNRVKKPNSEKIAGGFPVTADSEQNNECVRVPLTDHTNELASFYRDIDCTLVMTLIFYLIMILTFHSSQH